MAILSNNSLHIAVIGAGPIGLFLAIGLVNRGVQVTVYEKTSELKEIGVGIGFPENFVECMKLLDARLEVSLKKIAIKDSSGLRWVNGFTQEDIRKRPESKLFDMELPKEDGFTSYVCHRAELVAEMVNLLPTGTLHLGKQVAELDYGDLNTNCTLKFADGTTAKVDAVIGCDGIKSRVRQIVLGKHHPAATANYSGETVYRVLVEMDKAGPALGSLKHSTVLHMGQGANMVTYPVTGGKYLNVAAFVRGKDKDGEKCIDNLATIRDREEIRKSFAGFGPVITELVETLPEQLTCWPLYDMVDHPLEKYHFGNVCLAGDAAHASTPHLGSGAGMGVEDALALSVVLEHCNKLVRKDFGGRFRMVAKAFEAYDTVRRPRSQWLGIKSRRQGEMNKWLVPEMGSDFVKFMQETRLSLGGIVKQDALEIVDLAMKEFSGRVSDI